MGKDISGTVAIILSVLMILTGGGMAFQANKLNTQEPDGGYLKQKEDLEEKIYKKQAKQIDERKTLIRNMTKLVGWSKREAAVDVPTQSAAIEKTMDGLLVWFRAMAEKNPDWAAKLASNERIDFKTMTPWADLAKVELGDFLTVKKAISCFKNLEDHLTKQSEGVIKERDEARAEEDKYIGERGLQNVKEKELKEKIINQRKENEGLMSRIKEQATQKKDEINALDRSIQEQLEKLAEITAKGEEEMKVLRKDLGNVKDRIDQFQKRSELARASTEADGRITHSVPTQNYAWIDLGSKHTLLAGTRFEVFGLDKGGKKVPKGEIEVLKVWEDNSQVAIIKTLDSERPIEGGDYITNEVFDRSKTKVFAFAGRFTGKYSNEEAKKKIEEIGGAVVELATLDTAYVVVGKDFESDINYAKAQDWGIIIIREKDLYELMGIR